MALPSAQIHPRDGDRVASCGTSGVRRASTSIWRHHVDDVDDNDNCGTEHGDVGIHHLDDHTDDNGCIHELDDRTDHDDDGGASRGPVEFGLGRVRRRVASG